MLSFKILNQKVFLNSWDQNWPKVKLAFSGEQLETYIYKCVNSHSIAWYHSKLLSASCLSCSRERESKTLRKHLTTHLNANPKPVVTVKTLTQKQCLSALKLTWLLSLVQCSLSTNEKAFTRFDMGSICAHEQSASHALANVGGSRLCGIWRFYNFGDPL